jgi:aryl-alcohol dehydrogenase-like predicted oxidoreductase
MYAQTEEADHKVVDEVEALAKKKRVAQASLALAWMLAKPGITAPIAGATKRSHLEDAVAALGIKLTSEEIAALEEAYISHPVLGFS